MRPHRRACAAIVLLFGACLPWKPSHPEGIDIVRTPDVQPADPGPGDPGPGDPGSADVPPGPRVDCKSCTTDLECGGGARCLRMGTTRACLQPCVDNRDCPPAYFCYDGRTDGRFCQPQSAACVPCAFDAPCADGLACDFVTGECRAGGTTCCPCTWDFDCVPGGRCFKQVGQALGACVDECGPGRPCKDTAKFACREDSHGIPVCQPLGPDICGACPADRPYPGRTCGDCWACAEDSHCTRPPLLSCSPDTHICVANPPLCLADSACGPDEHCDPGTFACGGYCLGGRHECADGFCMDCCRDEDCAPNYQGACQNGVCGGNTDPCNGQCPGTQFPVCLTINNVPQCVRCGSDLDCQVPAGQAPCTCTGDPTYTCVTTVGNICPTPSPPCMSDYECTPIDVSCTCVGGPVNRCVWPDGKPCAGSGCFAFCMSDADCVPMPARCAIPSPQHGGICAALDGSCDGSSTCCGAGRSCANLPQILEPVTSAGTTVSPVCTCDTLRPCLAGVPCTPAPDLCALPHLGSIFCPGGVPDARINDGLCVDGAELDARLFPAK